MTAHKYKVAWKLTPLGEGKTKAELRADPAFRGMGATDQCIIFSTILPGDGSRGVVWNSLDGTGQALPPMELYQALMFLARGLALAGELDDERESLLWALWNAQVEAMGRPKQDIEEVRKIFREQPCAV